MITVDVEQVKAVIADDTEKVRYIDYITELSQALGIANHKITNDVAWHPSNLPAPRPIQKKLTGKEWHQEALERGYYINANWPHTTSKSLLGQLQKHLEDTTAYHHGIGGADYQYLYDTITENPLHRVFTGQPIGQYNSTAVAFYHFLRTVGCLALPAQHMNLSRVLDTLLPATIFADEKHSYWIGTSVEKRFEELGVDDLLPVKALDQTHEGNTGAPAFTIEDVENLDVNKITGSPVGKAYTSGFANLIKIIVKNNATKDALETVIPLLSLEGQKTVEE